MDRVSLERVGELAEADEIACAAGPSRWTNTPMKMMSEASSILKLTLSCATVALVLVTLFAWSARLWWAFDLFSHFRVQYLVAALVLGVVALVGRAYPSAAVLAVVALVHGWAVKDLWLGGTAAVASGGVPLRVASANVLSSNPSPHKVLDFVRASEADVVVLVEAQGEEWREVLATIGAGYPYRAPDGWHDNGASLILFSRHPIVADTVIRSPEGSRPYIATDIVVGGREVTVVGVHPSSPSPKDASDTRRRNLQLDYLADIIAGADGPVIVAGDFNTTPWSPHFRDLVMTAGLRNAADGQGYLATWPAWFWPAQIPIDHILVKGPVAVAGVARGPATGSDHYPVVAALRIAPE